jgi:parallel beta-helix repeat protein
MQGIPGAHDWNGFEFIGNVFVAAREDAITTDHDAQVIFLEDINAANTDANHYSNGTIAGNVIYSESNFGIALYNPINCRIVNNSMMGLIDGAGSRVPIEINQHFPTGTGSGNTILNNITTAASSVFSGDRVKANILVGPSSASYLTAFTGPTTAVPTTKAGILAQQTILSGSTADRQEPKAGAVGTGYFDYTARTYSLPTYPTYDLSGFVVTPQSTSAWLDVSTTSGSGTIYWMVSATPKTRAEVIAQGTATAKGTQAVSATGAQAQITATGLSPTTSYLFYIVQVNGSSVQSQMLYATGTTLVASSWNRVNSSAPARLIKTGGFSSATDTKTGTFAWRGKLLGNDGAFRKLITNGGVSFDVGFRTDNSFRISMFNSAVVEVLRLGTTGVTFNVALGEILLICSWDAAAGRSELYVNGTSRVVRTTVTNDFSAFTKTTNMGMFADYAGATPNNCETDYLLFDNAFVDIAVAGNRAIFDNSSLLGSDGSGATGQQPLVYVTGTASAWNGSPGTANLGRGGQFTSSGSFANV